MPKLEKSMLKCNPNHYDIFLFEICFLWSNLEYILCKHLSILIVACCLISFLFPCACDNNWWCDDEFLNVKTLSKEFKYHYTIKCHIYCDSNTKKIKKNKTRKRMLSSFFFNSFFANIINFWIFSKRSCQNFQSQTIPKHMQSKKTYGTNNNDSPRWNTVMEHT